MLVVICAMEFIIIAALVWQIGDDRKSIESKRMELLETDAEVSKLNRKNNELKEASDSMANTPLVRFRVVSASNGDCHVFGRAGRNGQMVLIRTFNTGDTDYDHNCAEELLDYLTKKN